MGKKQKLVRTQGEKKVETTHQNLLQKLFLETEAILVPQEKGNSIFYGKSSFKSNVTLEVNKSRSAFEKTDVTITIYLYSDEQISGTIQIIDGESGVILATQELKKSKSKSREYFVNLSFPQDKTGRVRLIVDNTVYQKAVA